LKIVAAKNRESRKIFRCESQNWKSLFSMASISQEPPS